MTSYTKKQCRAMLKTSICIQCENHRWFMGPEGGMTTMYRSPCGLWVAVSPFGAEIVDHDPNRWFNRHRVTLLGGDYGAASPFDGEVL